MECSVDAGGEGSSRTRNISGGPDTKVLRKTLFQHRSEEELASCRTPGLNREKGIVMSKNAENLSSKIKDALNAHEAGRPSRAEIMEALKAEGVESVEKLVDRLLESRKSVHPSGRGRGESVLAHQTARPSGKKKIAYHAPQVPLFVDGVSIDPADISRFDGQNLHFVVGSPAAGDKTALHALTGDDHINFLKGSYANSLFAGSQPQTTPIRADFQPFDAPFSYGQVQVFQDIDYGNNWTWVGANSAIQDLRWIQRGCFLWWCGDWNDQISSMGGTDTKVIYYWDINFSGPTLTVVTPYIAVPDLRVYGWNDEISSIWNVGY